MLLCVYLHFRLLYRLVYPIPRLLVPGIPGSLVMSQPLYFPLPELEKEKETVRMEEEMWRRRKWWARAQASN